MSKRMPVLCQEYMIGFCLPLNIQPTLNTQQQRRAPGAAPPHPPSHAPLLLCVRPWLNIQWQSKKHILLAEDGHIFLTCLQLVGTWVQNIFRNLVPDFLTCPQLVGTWVKNIFRNLVPYFLTCPQLVGTWVQNVFRNSGPDFLA